MHGQATCVVRAGVRYLTLAGLVWILGCAYTSANSAETPTHAQGEMAGEVTADSVILQSRLTSGGYVFIPGADSQVAPDVPGCPGVGCFEISTDLDFKDSFQTKWMRAVPERDFIIKTRVSGLKNGTRYFYRLLYGIDSESIRAGSRRTFKTLAGKDVASKVSFVVVTGMNFEPFRMLYPGEDGPLGYPALKAIRETRPDYFIGTGDNVYYDVPTLREKKPANKIPERFLRPAAETQPELRKKWHEQFVQPRFVNLFAEVATYWEKDDHDYRYNDCDATGDWKPSHELGAKTFLEQVPIVDPDDPEPKTYRTHRVNSLLQIWLVEAREYRSPKLMEDGPEKTLWGVEQREWIKKTLLESDASFKLLISPTPMIGPDGRNRQDNHTSLFLHERDEFFRWLMENELQEKGLYIVCGDRHWQYHSISPEGVEEFSCGSMCDANATRGHRPGEAYSNDPEGRIRQPYAQDEPSGGFLKIRVTPAEDDVPDILEFTWYDENGVELHSTSKTAP